MELEKYELLKEIGGGSYGKVFKAKEKLTGRKLAVKLISKVRKLFNCSLFVYSVLKWTLFSGSFFRNHNHRNVNEKIKRSLSKNAKFIVRCGIHTSYK